MRQESRLIEMENFTIYVCYSKMVTDVSDDELRTPQLSMVDRSPSVVSSVVSPLMGWTLNFENEIGTDLLTLLADMEGETATAVAPPSMSPSAASAGVTAEVQPSTTARVVDAPLLAAVDYPSSEDSDDDTPPKRKRKPELKSNAKERIRAGYLQNRRRSWDSDIEDNTQVVTKYQVARRKVQLRDEEGNLETHALEFQVDPPVPRVIRKCSTGHEYWIRDPKYDTVVLTQADIELLFFFRAKHDMPTRVLVLLTIKSQAEWKEFMKEYTNVPNCEWDTEKPQWHTGRLQHAYDETHVVDPKYAGPNIEWNGLTICIACGNVTERYSIHVFCVLHIADNGQHWCTFDGVCQLCIMETPKVLRARYRRFHAAFLNIHFARQHYRKKVCPRKIRNQHHANVEQVIKLKKQYPNWVKPAGFEVPRYTFKDFKPPPRMNHRVVVADAPVKGELLSLGRRLLPQGDSRPVRVFSYRQLDQIARTYCDPPKIQLTTGAEEEVAVRAFLLKQKEEEIRRRKERRLKAKPNKKVARAATERSTEAEEADDDEQAMDTGGNESVMTDDQAVGGDGEPGDEECEMGEGYTPNATSSGDEETSDYEPPETRQRKRQKTVDVSCPAAKNQLTVSNDEQTVVTSHEQAPPIKQNRASPNFDIELTRDSPEWIAIHVRKELVDRPLTHGTGHIEYSVDESGEPLTASLSPASDQTASVFTATPEVAARAEDTTLTSTAAAVTDAVSLLYDLDRAEVITVQQDDVEMDEAHQSATDGPTQQTEPEADTAHQQRTDSPIPQNDAVTNEVQQPITDSHAQADKEGDGRQSDVPDLRLSSSDESESNQLNKSAVVSWNLALVQDIVQPLLARPSAPNLDMLANVADLVKQKHQEAIDKRLRRLHHQEQIRLTQDEEAQRQAREDLEEYINSADWQRDFHDVIAARKREQEELQIAESYKNQMVRYECLARYEEMKDDRKLVQLVRRSELTAAGWTLKEDEVIFAGINGIITGANFIASLSRVFHHRAPADQGPHDNAQIKQRHRDQVYEKRVQRMGAAFVAGPDGIRVRQNITFPSIVGNGMKKQIHRATVRSRRARAVPAEIEMELDDGVRMITAAEAVTADSGEGDPRTSEREDHQSDRGQSLPLAGMSESTGDMRQGQAISGRDLHVGDVGIISIRQEEMLVTGSGDEAIKTHEPVEPGKPMVLGADPECPITISSEPSAENSPPPTPYRSTSPLHHVVQQQLHRQNIGGRFKTPTQLQSQTLTPFTLSQPQLRQPERVLSPYQLNIAPVVAPVRPRVRAPAPEPKPWCPIQLPAWLRRALPWRKSQ